MTSSPSKRTRATVDTNLFVSGFIRPGLPAQLMRAWLAQVFRLVTTAPLRDEVRRVLFRPKFAAYGLTPARINDVLDALAAAEQAVPLDALPLRCRDPHDDMFLACALGGQVDYLVTGDRDLLSLADDPALGTVRVVTVRDFLVAIGQTPTT